MPKGEKTKQLWANSTYREKMMLTHKTSGGWNRVENWKRCLLCKKSFRSAPAAERKFCSKICGDKGRLKKNPAYSTLHKWVYRNLGKAKKCEKCNMVKGRIEWANKSKKYKRNIDDWFQLCIRCHMKYDGHGKYWLGKKFSKEHRKNLSISHKHVQFKRIKKNTL